MAMFLSRLERQALVGFGICVVLMAILHEATQLKDVAETIQTQVFEDHYSTLGVAADATQAEIATGFKRAMTKLNSKQQADQRNRARINAAHSVLSNSTAKAAYDKHRNFLKAAIVFLASAFVSIPAIILLRFFARMVFGVSDFDPRSFLGKVSASLEKVEFKVQVQLSKDRGESFGAQLQADRSGKTLRICGISSDGVIARHNDQVQREGAYSLGSSTQPPGMLWWNAPLLWEGDIVESVNDIKGQASDLMSALKSSESSQLLIRRSFTGNTSIWPWICERRVSRETSERWGFNLRTCDGSDSLQVDGIQEGGIARWNEANPDSAIRVGDRIVAVDQSVGSKEMLAALTEPKESLCLLVVRGVLMPSSFPQSSEEVLCGPIYKSEGQKLGIRIGRCIESPPASGILAEPGNLGSIVVKEVVRDHLVYDWNSRRESSSQLQPGCVVTAVNGCRRKEEFARELSKQQVCISFRKLAATLVPQTQPEARGRSVNIAARPLDIRLDQEELQPWAIRTFGSWVPAFLLPRPFEEQLRNRLRELRCEFDVKICKTDARALGLKVKQAGEELQVMEVVEDGEVARYNRNLKSPSEPRVEQNDWLVGADDQKVPGQIVLHLSAVKAEVVLHLARPASKSAPGVWEIEVGKTPGEGWGLELSTPGPHRSAVLSIQAVGTGAIQKWNESQETQWRVQPGDLLVACEPEVEPMRILKRLRDVQSVRLTLLRWHTGPAPLPEVPSEPKKRIFEVTVYQQANEQIQPIGLRLKSPLRDPTRSVVEEVNAGSLVYKHNQVASESERIMKGDEVLSVNGDANSNHFAEISKKSSRIVIRVARLHDPSTEGIAAKRVQAPEAPHQSPVRVVEETAHQEETKDDADVGSTEGRTLADRGERTDGVQNFATNTSQATHTTLTTDVRAVPELEPACHQVVTEKAAEPCPVPRSSAPENIETSIEETLKLLTLPPEAAIASLALGLDPLSKEHFNQSMSKLKDLVAAPRVLSCQ